MTRRLLLVGATVAAVALSGATVAAVAVPGATAVVCSPHPAPVTSQQADRVWDLASRRLAAQGRQSSFPFGATGSSRLVRTSEYEWTAGFYPTSLWLVFQRTGDPEWLARARAFTDQVATTATLRSNHDLGFMVGMPTGLGAALDPDPARRVAYARAHDTAARSLSTRWNAAVGALKSATYSGRWGLIIDSAMNAPLLIETDEPRLRARGVRHMRTLATDFVRANGSTVHRQAFNPRTGRSLGVLYGQGRSTSSTWSRGQAWAINGFSRAYALTRDEQLLAAARRTADYWIQRVPTGCVPAWDLAVPDPREPLDSSAAAIAADGMLQLAAAEPDPARAVGYRDYALAALGTLAAPPFVVDRGRGLLQRQAYSIPLDRREGTYVWGDAFLLSALSRAFTGSPDLSPVVTPAAGTRHR